MAITMNEQSFGQWIQRLGQIGEVYGPMRLAGKGSFSDTDRINYGLIEQASALNLSHKTYLSPKELVFPTRETLFRFSGPEVKVPELSEAPIFVFLRPCDVNGIQRLDEIFLNNGQYADPYYQRRRSRLKMILMPCPDKGFDSCFCVSMGTNTCNEYSAVLKVDEKGYSISATEALLEETLTALGENIDNFAPDFVKENRQVVQVPEVGQIKLEHFDHPIWQEYTARCIACGRCNTSCVSCSCFTMQDVMHSGQVGERRRRWASCHVKGYSDMAGGHSFRTKNGERMRFKTMHKINDFHKRFGKHMCVGCGRCDDVCPEYISFSKCINKLNQVIAEEGANADAK